MFVSFKKCFGTDTLQTSPFTTTDRQKSSSETSKWRYVRLSKKKEERCFNYDLQVFIYNTLVI